MNQNGDTPRTVRGRGSALGGGRDRLCSGPHVAGSIGAGCRSRDAHSWRGYRGGLWLAPRILGTVRWHRPIRLLRDPVPDHWAQCVRDNVPLSRDLSPDDFERLLKLVQVFLKKKRFEAAGGLDLTEEMCLTVSAQACMLLVWRDTGLFPGLRTILLYPHAVIPKRVGRAFSHGGVESEEHDRALLGESWTSGVVILSWDSAQHGAFDPRDGKNVILHEFAHQLDQESGAADGVELSRFGGRVRT